MFTPLNFGPDGFIQPDQRLFPAGGAASGTAGRTASFAATLDTSLRTQAAGGDFLPVDGGALPPVLDLSLQIAAIEERASGTPHGGALELPQHAAEQTVLPGAVAARGQREETGSEALAAALQFMTGTAGQPETESNAEAGRGNGNARPGGPLAGESEPANPLNTAKPEAPASPVATHSPARAAEAGERRPDSSRTQTMLLSGASAHQEIDTKPADSPVAAMPADNDAAQDSRVAELRLAGQSSAIPDPVARPPAGTGPADDLPVELPVYRPGSAAVPEASATAESTAAATVGSADGSQKASPRLAPLPPIATPVGQSDWGESLSERVLVMTSGKLGNAEIRLTPAELGPVRVQVSVDDGTATVSFQASHAATRDAIEQAMPRLREMLSENGLSLGQASVGDQGVHDGSREAADDSASASGALVDAGDEPAGDMPVEPGAGRVSSALVDTFA